MSHNLLAINQVKSQEKYEITNAMALKSPPRPKKAQKNEKYYNTDSTKNTPL
jgi:hypothetical protein